MQTGEALQSDRQARRVSRPSVVSSAVLGVGLLLSSVAGRSESQDIRGVGPRPATAVPRVPALARWEQNLRGISPQGRPPVPGPSTYARLYGSSTALGNMDGDNHYDPLQVFLGGRAYARSRREAGDLSWDPRWFDPAVQAAVHQYRDLYLIPNACRAAGYHAHNTGLAWHYLETGDALSRDVAILMSRRSAGSDDQWPIENSASFEASREVAFSILMRLNAEDLGQAHRTRTDELVSVAIGHIDQWTASRRSHCLYVRPFMVGLTLEALIAYWDRYRDPRIPPKVKLALDWLRANAWSPTGGGTPGTGAFLYTDIDVGRLDPIGCQGHGYSPEGGGQWPAPDLSLLIAPAYAWYYLHSGDPTYRAWGDEAWAGSSGVNTIYTQKVYNQTYRWSRRFLEWRERGNREWPAPTVIRLTGPAPAAGRANAPSPLFRVGFDAPRRAVPRPVLITPSDGGRGGSFLPRTVRLTSDQPEASFRYRPASNASGTLSIGISNDGGLANPSPAPYTVQGSAPLATGYTIQGPKSGYSGRLARLTVALEPAGAVPPPSADGEGGLITILVTDSTRLGDFSPRVNVNAGMVWLSADLPTMDLVYQPTKPGRVTVRARSEGGLSNPPDFAYEVVATRPDASYRPRAGDRAVLFDGAGPGVVPVLIDEAAFREYQVAMGRADGRGRLQILRHAKRFFVLPDGLDVEILRPIAVDSGESAIEVRFSNGPLSGQSALVPSQFVTRMIGSKTDGS